MESLDWTEKTAAPPDDTPVQEARIDDDGTVYDFATGEVLHRPRASLLNLELPACLARPAGLLSSIANWIFDSAQRPNRVLALGAAVSVVGTIIGRRVAGPTSSGTHQYIAMLAPSGSGKDHPLRRAAALLRAIDETLVGPGEIMSQTALARHVGDHPLSLSPLDEFGALINRVCAARARKRSEIAHRSCTIASDIDIMLDPDYENTNLS